MTSPTSAPSAPSPTSAPSPISAPAPTPAAAPAPARPPLDRQRIVSAALDFIDVAGLDALSMRKLGAQLGVEAMALYHYFPSKAALLDGVVALVLGQLALPDRAPRKRDDWPALIRRVARSFRQLGRAHPHVFPLLATVGFDNPATLAPAEAVLAVLARAGLEPADAFAAFVALHSYVVGQVLWANAERAAAPPQPRVAATTYPHLAAYVGSAGADPLDLEAKFEAGLEMLIDGIRARLGRR